MKSLIKRQHTVIIHNTRTFMVNEEHLLQYTWLCDDYGKLFLKMFLKLAECLRKLLVVIYNYKFNSLHHFKHCLWCYLLLV